MEDGQIITIKEARKLLEGDARELSDAQVEELINELDFMATIAIKQYAAEQAGQGTDNAKDNDQAND